MASASSLWSEEHFLCPICMDVFTDPVSTPCGHNYCKRCITRYWDSSDVCRCPLCNGTFPTRLQVSVNTFISEMVHQFRRQKFDAELRRIQQYAADVTLDPDTAHRRLTLSEDGKLVSCGDVSKDLPDSAERFSTCVCVLGKQSFSSGRFYYEVQVKGKTKWDLGVARESINRKGDITTIPSNGYWIIVLRNGDEYWARAGPAVPLPVREKVQTVGVFVDYEEGLVSFYDVEARIHLFSFTGCSFTEKLYPFFCPALNNDGKNSSPLIISPVNHTV